jgi:ABC-2 type transport system ATP-binding protein
MALRRAAQPASRRQAGDSGPCGPPRSGTMTTKGATTAAPVEVCGLTKRFGPLIAVDGLSFTVNRGMVTGFLGPNGAGKTTTLRMLLGLATPSAGSATINGSRYQDLRDPLRMVGAVLESPGAHPGRTAVNHLRIQAMAGDVPAGRIAEVLDLAGLADAAGRRVREFSLGMRQRLGLATALLCDPEIVILDEPANGLDPQGVHWLRGLLRDLAAEQRAVLVSSHIIAEVAQTADSVVIIDEGRLIVQATVQELTAGRYRDLEAAFLGLTGRAPEARR